MNYSAASSKPAAARGASEAGQTHPEPKLGGIGGRPLAGFFVSTTKKAGLGLACHAKPDRPNSSCCNDLKAQPGPKARCDITDRKTNPYKKRQHLLLKPGLTHRSCPRDFSIPRYRNAITSLSLAALANARKPGFSALLFSDDVKSAKCQIEAPREGRRDSRHFERQVRRHAQPAAQA